jgi:hypothetical protein
MLFDDPFDRFARSEQFILISELSSKFLNPISNDRPARDKVLSNIGQFRMIGRLGIKFCPILDNFGKIWLLM